MKRSGIKRRRGFVPPNASTQPRDARADAVRIAFERDRWECQAAKAVPDVACMAALEGHEPKTRARGGDPLDPDQILTVCVAHHRWIHDHPAAAHELGLLRHSWEGA